MNNSSLRVRFAPAPTGMMHLGNIRTALMNYLIAEQKQGTFVLRIEDTDPERNFDPTAEKIIEDLNWLGITYHEGPHKEVDNQIYFQSQRTQLYEKQLQELIAAGHAYRCFCSSEELEKRRQRQIALKKPPRYDRKCLHLAQEESDDKAKTEPFIWRMKLDHELSVTITDLAHGDTTFDLKNFSDFPLTRQNGTVTFMFANFVDDIDMNITCVIRGEDHLSNTAGQAALYHACNKPLPTFWHMPILCNIDGRKLSKRDFGFSLRDLKDAGFLPEAIINYLAIIGGSFTQEIMTQEALISTIDFDKPSTTGQIKYDVEKLRWVNQKWISTYAPEKLTALCTPLLHETYPQVKKLSDAELTQLISTIQTEMVVLHDCINLLTFYFAEPIIDQTVLKKLCTFDQYTLFKQALSDYASAESNDAFLQQLKQTMKKNEISFKKGFTLIRYLLTGKQQGLGIKELFTVLDKQTLAQRLK